MRCLPQSLAWIGLAAGMWPISYNNCSGSEKVPWSSLQPQRVTACEDRPQPSERARLGLLPGQGRGAPELDILEVSVAGGNTPERYTPPHLAQSLQARLWQCGCCFRYT